MKNDKWKMENGKAGVGGQRLEVGEVKNGSQGPGKAGVGGQRSGARERK